MEKSYAKKKHLTFVEQSQKKLRFGKITCMIQMTMNVKTEYQCHG